MIYAVYKMNEFHLYTAFLYNVGKYHQKQSETRFQGMKGRWGDE